MTPLQRFVEDHKEILQKVAASTGIINPMAIDLDSYFTPLLKQATRGKVLPLDGVLIRDWDPYLRKYWPGLRFGIRMYELSGISFARVFAKVSDQSVTGYDFFVVASEHYQKLYRLAVRAMRNDEQKVSSPPVLPDNLAELLKKNTVDYLLPKNLKRIKELGGRPKRGLMLVGPPGNGKTSVCRWIWDHCRHEGIGYRFVSPDDYREARSASNASVRVKQLFAFDSPGIVFFDDFDVALRNRDKGYESDDQAVFLGALDGIEVNEGVVYVFTTNCDLELIDPAIRRPGRVDLVLEFPNPDAKLRRGLVQRWHHELQAALDVELVVDMTDGLSFAEMDELKNLMVMRYIDTNTWEWNWAVKQFETNRRALGTKRNRGPVGFAAASNAPAKWPALVPSVNCQDS